MATEVAAFRQPSSSSFLILITLLLLFLISSPTAAGWSSSELVLEEGYAVSTVLDGDKLSEPIHLFSLLPSQHHQDHNPHLFLLDSSNSAFYTVSFPVSQGFQYRVLVAVGSEIIRLSGKGVAGFSDGDSTGAMFDHPRSFAVDPKGNVYVADRSNHAIRKIATSGMTTTIAGGYSNKTGHTDGPAQNATFSNDFELVFIPKMCALLICDRGNRLVRQMDLKPEDCAHKSQSGLGTTSVSLIAVLSALFGSVLGFIAHSFLASREVSGNHSFNKTWRHYQTHLGTLVATICSDIRSAIAKSTPYMIFHKILILSLSYLVCIFRIPRKEKPAMCRKTPSLLDSDAISNHASNVFADQLKDLISFNGDLGALEMNRSSEQEDEKDDVSKGYHGRIDDMIRASISDFTDNAKHRGQSEGYSVCNSSLVKRRQMGVYGHR